MEFVFVEQCGMSKYSALELEIERVEGSWEERCGCVWCWSREH